MRLAQFLARPDWQELRRIFDVSQRFAMTGETDTHGAISGTLRVLAKIEVAGRL